HVEATEAIDRLGHHPFGVLRDTDVRTHKRHLSSAGAELGGGLRAGLAIATDDRDPGPSFEKYCGDALADALGRAGHEDAPAGYGGEHSAASPTWSRGLTGTSRRARTSRP